MSMPVTAVTVTFDGTFTPYVRMTRRGKFVNERAQQYMASQDEMRARFKEQLIHKGHRSESFPIFKNGQPIRAWLLISMSSGLHKQDSDNQYKAITDSAAGILFENDLWIDALMVERSLGERDYFELIVSVHPPEYPPMPEFTVGNTALSKAPGTGKIGAKSGSGEHA